MCPPCKRPRRRYCQHTTLHAVRIPANALVTWPTLFGLYGWGMLVALSTTSFGCYLSPRHPEVASAHPELAGARLEVGDVFPV